MKNIYAILPCYNEEENIGKLIEEWNKQQEELKNKKYNLKIVAIDDCSTDKTQKVILEKKKKFENVDIIIHQQNKGLCGGLNSAINYFNQNAKKGDLLVLMDGDNTHDPKYVHNMLELLRTDKNCIIASRYREGANIVGLAKNRELMSDFAKLYYKAVLNIPNVKDYTCGYRMYTYEIIDKLLKKFGDNPIKEKSFACMMELLYKIYLVGGNFDEVGFELRYDNKCGASKMKVLKTARRSITTAIKLKLRYDISSLICMIALIFFSIFLSLGTNYSPTNNNIILHDCGIFSYIAFAMQKGRALYTEVWENKGPLLYIIYYIGLCLKGTTGIYILELISIFISTLFSYKTLYILTNKKSYSLLGLIYVYSMWYGTFFGGTFSESFALPLICIGIYLFTKYIFKDKYFKSVNIFIFGILTGLIAQLRLNMLSVFLGIFLAIGIKLIYKKEFKEIGRWILWGIIGFICSIIPTSIYLIKNNILWDCLNTAYFNILSGFNVGNLNDRMAALKVMINYANISFAMYLTLGFAVIAGVLINLNKIKKFEKQIYILGVILAIIINLYANSISGAAEMHYFITFIPIVVMVVGLVLKGYDKLKIKHNVKVQFLLFLIIVLSFNSYYTYTKYVLSKMEPVDDTNSYIAITQYIINNTEDDDYVQLIGGREESVSANFRSKRLSPSKYSYLPLWSSFTKERKEEMTNELIQEVKDYLPKLIFVCKTNEKEFNKLIYNKEAWNDFLEQNYTIDTQTIYNYVLYIRK